MKKNDRNTNDYDMEIVKRLYRSTFPAQYVTHAATMIGSVATALIVSSFFGANALAVFTFIIPISYLVDGFNDMHAAGVQILAGQALGRGDKKNLNKIFNTGIFMSAVVGAVISLALFLFPKLLAGVLGAEGETYQMTANYLKGWAFGNFFLMVSGSMMPFLHLDRDRKRISFSTTLMFALEISLNLINGAFLKFGMTGSGWIHTISIFASFVICSSHFFSARCIFRFRLKDIDLKSVPSIMKLGAPAFAVGLSDAFCTAILNYFLLAYGGPGTMVAFSICGNVFSGILAPIMQAHQSCTSLLASFLFGQEDPESLRNLPRITLKESMKIVIPVFLAVELLAGSICRLFGAPEESLAYYSMIVRLGVLVFPWKFLNFSASGTYNGMGKPRMVAIFCILSDTLFRWLYCSVLAPLWGVVAPMISSSLTEPTIFLMILIYYRVQSGKFPKPITESVYVPQPALSESREIALTVRTLDEVVSASQQVIDFCTDAGIDRRRAYYSGLCLEEIAVDTITNRFADKNSIDLRVFCNAGKMKIIFRDDCKAFDLPRWLDMHSSEDPARAIGLKMVDSLAEKMNYTIALGLNVLRIEL